MCTCIYIYIYIHIYVTMIISSIMLVRSPPPTRCVARTGAPPPVTGEVLGNYYIITRLCCVTANCYIEIINCCTGNYYIITL